MSRYSDRKWLNPDGHPSTGSVVAYHGESPWYNGDEKERDIMTYLEVSDCQRSMRLHRAEIDTLEDFILKMETLRDVIDEFVTFLKDVK